jgi:UPF0755 protein
MTRLPARRRAPRRDTFGGKPPRPKWLIALLSAAATLAVVLLIGAAWAAFTVGGPGPEARQGKATTVILERGSGLSSIANELEEAGVVRSAPLFMLVARLNGAAGDLKAGEYAFESRASLTSVLDKIRRGRIVRHFVTIPEGVTSEMAVEILMRSPVLEGSAPAPAEGTLLPETYDVQRGEDRAAVLARMSADHDRVLAELWTKRDRSIPVDTPREAVILASIVEKETGIRSERPRVAAVFVNRLRKGMRLETDPTVIYGVSGGRPLGRGLRRSELQTPTPYNTYLIAGLPPGPIANPGREALAAVMNPPKTDELFFVADGTGGHVFAKTFDEHLRNVAKWRAVERQRAGAASAPAVAPSAP